jgi:hypothetical protein
MVVGNVLAYCQHCCKLFYSSVPRLSGVKFFLKFFFCTGLKRDKHSSLLVLSDENEKSLTFKSRVAAGKLFLSSML